MLFRSAAQAELAAGQGQAAFAAYVDCEKCYDHIPIHALESEGHRQGLGALVGLATAQYRGDRFLKWAGAVSQPVAPSHGIPAGCPLANGMLHLHLVGAMRHTERQAEGVHLRTYADDWRLFAAGARREAARALVHGFRVAKDALEDRGMVVSLTKTVLLASGADARVEIRRAHV